MKNLMFKSWVKSQMIKQSVKDKAQSARDYLMTEKGGADSIIIAVIIIVVVLVLGFAFRGYIVGWFNQLVGQGSEVMANNSDPNAGISTYGT